MADLTDEQREAALRAIRRALEDSDPEGRGDNFAVLLCEIFDRHPDCPEEEQDDEYGWKPWVVEQEDRAAHLLASEALDALIAQGWGPGGARVRALKWTDFPGYAQGEGADGCRYGAYEVMPGLWRCGRVGALRLGERPTLAEAQALAQSDYDARVRLHLEADPAGWGPVAEAEARGYRAGIETGRGEMPEPSAEAKAPDA